MQNQFKIRQRGGPLIIILENCLTSDLDLCKKIISFQIHHREGKFIEPILEIFNTSWLMDDNNLKVLGQTQRSRLDAQKRKFT